MSTCTQLSAFFVLAGLLTAAPAADWPSYRHDPQRSGVTDEQLALPLTEAWRHQPRLTPQPAWPELPAVQDVWHRVKLGPTTTYDRAYAAAVVGGRVYYGSSADDSVYCLDTADGRTLWSFTTEGPVRLAPQVFEGRVYAGSDDGCLYCLDAANGRLLWKHLGGPEDRRLPGNQRMISRWPIRCGIVVEAGRVYFCAGLFPSQGSWLCALDAASGRERWKEPIEISAQGYLLASPTRLFVPTGRTAPRTFDRESGKDQGALPGSGVDTRAGGCFAVVCGDQISYSGGEGGGVQFAAPESKEKVVFADGLRIVARGDTSYIVTNDRLLAIDRGHYLELARLQGKKTKTEADRRRIAELGGPRKTFVKWESACQEPHELILAGDLLFVGGRDRVYAYSVDNGDLRWTGTVAGKAYALAVADDALWVSTDRGTVHCFRPGPSKPAVQAPYETPVAAIPFDQRDEELRVTGWQIEAAEAAIKTLGSRQGYCLMLGLGSGRMTYELARRSQFHVIVREPDAAKVAEGRKRFHEAGLYGSRISIHQGDLDRLPYPDYVANLVVCEESLSGRFPPSITEIARVLRPCGGTVALTVPKKGELPERLAAWGREKLPDWRMEPCGKELMLATARRGALPGAGDWSHFHADPGNTACSGDSMVAGPVDVQWFGRPGPRRMVDRHDKNTAPLYCDGRLFISGDNYIAGVDAYNGAILWERDIPDSVRLGAFKHSGNMAATPDWLYVASGSDCLGLDAQTGQTRLTISAEPGEDGRPSEWGYVASVGNLLVGTSTRPGAAFREQTIETEVLIWRDFMPLVVSQCIFAHDRHDGKARWKYTPEGNVASGERGHHRFFIPAPSVILTPTIAIGGGTVYFVESSNPAARQVPDGRVPLDMLLGKGARLVALELSTGKVLWREPVDLARLQHMIFMSYAKDILVITGTRNVPLEDRKLRVRYDLWGFDAKTGKQLWQTTQVPTPDHILQGPHGEQVQHSAIVGDVIYNTGFAVRLQTGEPMEVWKWKKSGHCATLSTSARCAFSRYGPARMFDLASGEYNDLTKVTRPGCWINTLPAGGLVLIPEASAGCICGYSLQTSLAVVPRSR